MNDRSRLHGWHPENEFRLLIEAVKHIIENPKVERNMLMALSAQVAKLVEEVRQNNDLAKANNAALVLQASQISDLKSTVASLKAGQTVNEEDVAAINQAVDVLADTNKELQEAVPANTSADANPAKPQEDGSPLTAGTQPVTHDVAGNPIAPDAPGQPEPPKPDPAQPSAQPADAPASSDKPST